MSNDVAPLNFAKLIHFFLSFSVLSGCGTLPSRAALLTDRNNLAELEQSIPQGYVAFVYNSDVPANIDVDVKHQETGKSYRIRMNPGLAIVGRVSLGPWEVARSEDNSDFISDSVAIYALPEGTYLPTYNYYRRSKDDHRGYKATAEQFTVKAGEITSFGHLKIDFVHGLLKSTDIDIMGDGASIEQNIKKIEEGGFASMPITNQPFSSTMD
jgi:hypothetical protein